MEIIINYFLLSFCLIVYLPSPPKVRSSGGRAEPLFTICSQGLVLGLALSKCLRLDSLEAEPEVGVLVQVSFEGVLFREGTMQGLSWR